MHITTSDTKVVLIGNLFSFKKTVINIINIEYLTEKMQ